MRAAELAIVDALRGETATVTELAEMVGKSQSWTSELVSSLEEQHIVTKNRTVELADTHEATLLAELVDTYAAEKLLVGPKEEILSALLAGPRTMADLQRHGFAPSTLYKHLSELQETGVVTETDEGYALTDDTVRSFLEARQNRPFATTYTTNDETLVVTTDADSDGYPTAFSAFTRYGVEYHPAKQYIYEGPEPPTIAEVLVHAVKTATNRKQTAMTAIFYLTHRDVLDQRELWQLAKRWECVERWADMQAFIDQRDVHRDELFLPWEEFVALAHDYDVYPRGHHPADGLERGLTALGETLQESIDVYLLGGGNLILRGLKDATKDIDLVVDDEATLRSIVDGLRDLGYEDRGDPDGTYERLDASVILEKEGAPRWDIFVQTVADKLQLTDEMQARCDEHRQYEQLQIHLLSPTDMFLFKSITEREGDLEDAALLARQTDVDWEMLLAEIKRQERRTEQLYAFSVLDTLDILETRYDIVAPIKDELVSYCLERGLLFTLDEPKTIEDLREEFDFPDYRLYNTLRKLEREGRITVDRSGPLNSYQRTGPLF